MKEDEMSHWIKLKAADEHELDAYVAEPAGEIRGGLIVVQEIFGVNEHIRQVAEHYAQQGYLAIAPALFDRIERGVQLSYDEAGRKHAFSLYPQLKPEASLLDIAAAFRNLQKRTEKIGVLGFCYGGLLAWLSATRGTQNGMKPACTVGYYAGGIGAVAQETPECPVLLHFGADDSHIGSDQVNAVREAHPDLPVHVYPGAGHAFNRSPDPESYSPKAAASAQKMTEEFLAAHLS